jgi:signal transduction histidine kinase
MRLSTIGVEHQIEEQCRALLEEMAPGQYELASSLHGGELQESDFYIWDFQPEHFSHGLRPQIVARSLFLVEPGMLDGFRRGLGALRASVVLKPARSAALRPFLEHILGSKSATGHESENVSELVGQSRETEELLERLLHANLRLQEYEQARTNSLARAMHDFRVPLTALNGYCGLLLGQGMGLMSPSQMDLVRRMQHSIKRLTRLAEAMLELSMGQLAQSELVIEEGDIEGSIAQAVHEVALHAQEKQIRIETVVEQPSEPLLFDVSKIERVLINLLENSCKFTPRQGTIHLSAYSVCWDGLTQKFENAAKTAGDGAVIANAYRIDLRDSGCGVPSEHAESIFEEFATYAGGQDRSGGGLGLAICRMAIDAHRGRIWAESNSVGTQFSFVLPYPNVARRNRPPTRQTAVGGRFIGQSA